MLWYFVNVNKLNTYMYYEQKSRHTNVRTFLIRQNLKFLPSVLLVAHLSDGTLVGEQGNVVVTDFSN